MHLPRFIVLCGAQGAGKSTAAKIISRHLGYEIVPLAAPLKAMLRVGLGLTKDHTDGDLKELPCSQLLGQTPRYAMQTLGTEWGRTHIHQQIWIEAWRNMATNYPRVVVDDARFENEFQALRELGAMVVGIHRPGHQVKLGHASEEEWRRTALDLVFNNHGSQDDLKRAILARFSGDKDAFPELIDFERHRMGLPGGSPGFLSSV